MEYLPAAGQPPTPFLGGHPLAIHVADASDMAAYLRLLDLDWVDKQFAAHLSGRSGAGYFTDMPSLHGEEVERTPSANVPGTDMIVFALCAGVSGGDEGLWICIVLGTEGMLFQCRTAQPSPICRRPRSPTTREAAKLRAAAHDFLMPKLPVAADRAHTPR